MPPADIRLPLDCSGLAPRTRKWSVRSTSGTGNSNWCPSTWYCTNWWGNWSTDVAENRFGVRSARISNDPNNWGPRLWALGLPR